MSHQTHNIDGDAGHEESGVRVAGVVWFLIFLGIGVVFVGWLMVGLVGSFEEHERKSELESRPSPFAAQRPKLPPEPRLQLAPASEEQIDKREPPDLKRQHPLEEMKQLRESWNAKLQSYEWVDQQNGIVRIPIEDAKRMLLERGLPTRAKTELNASGK